MTPRIFSCSMWDLVPWPGIEPQATRRTHSPAWPLDFSWVELIVDFRPPEGSEDTFLFLSFFYRENFSYGPFKKSLLNLLEYYFYFMFWLPGWKACGILAPWPGMEATLPAVEGEVLTTGSPGKSLNSCCFKPLSLRQLVTVAIGWSVQHTKEMTGAWWQDGGEGQVDVFGDTEEEDMLGSGDTSEGADGALVDRKQRDWGQDAGWRNGHHVRS